MDYLNRQPSLGRVAVVAFYGNCDTELRKADIDDKIDRSIEISEIVIVWRR